MPFIFRPPFRTTPYSTKWVGAGTGGSVVTLTAEVGAYSLSGIANIDQLIVAAPTGTYALAGVSAGLVRRMVAATGTYSLSGVANVDQIRMAAATGAYTLSGIANVDQISMVAATGTYSLSGIEATLRRGKILIADVGTYTHTGVANVDQIRMVAATGTYSLTGISAGLVRRMVAATGTYSLSGVANVDQIRMAAATGTYTLSGIANVDQIRMVAAAGSYNLTGIAATLIKGKTLIADVGTYTLTGIANVDQIRMAAGTGTYSLSGQAATLISPSIKLTAATGAYTLTGIANVDQIRMAAGTGTYSLSGQAATLFKGKTLLAAAGSYSLSGIANVDQIRMMAASGAYNQSGMPTIEAVNVVYFWKTLWVPKYPSLRVGARGHWKADGGGLVVRDTLERKHGRRVGATWKRTAGRYGWEVDGTDDYVDFGQPYHDGWREFTLTAWLYRSASSTNVFLGIEKPNGTTERTEIDWWGDGNIYFFMLGKGGGTFQELSAIVANTQTGWHHFALRFFASGATDTVRMQGYVDGVKQTLTYTAGNGAVGIEAPDSSARLLFGAYDTNGPYYGAGSMIAEVTLHERALSAWEIRLLAREYGAFAELVPKRVQMPLGQPTTQTLACDKGIYAWDGAAAGLVRRLSSAAGTYTLSGQSIRDQLRLATLTGQYTLAGQTNTLISPAIVRFDRYYQPIEGPSRETYIIEGPSRQNTPVLVGAGT